MRRVSVIVGALGLLASIASCEIVLQDGTATDGGPDTTLYDGGEELQGDGSPLGKATIKAVSFRATAASGGTGQLDDGTKIEIPAGAVSSDTDIVMARPTEQAFGPASMVAGVSLEPHGLKFAKPIKVTLPFNALAVDKPENLRMASASSANPQTNVGGETNAFALEPNATRVGDTFVTSTDHFSMLALFYYPDLFVAPEIPGKYLRSGDILYAMTSASQYFEASIFPIHVGLFVKDGTNNHVIESTIPETNCTTQKGVVDSEYDGEKGFRNLCGHHIFLGARRPFAATVAQGEAAAKKAAEYRGSGYGILGSSTIGSMTCVQLAEKAWESGAGVYPCKTPNILLTPHNQYEQTVPVNWIDLPQKDGTIRIPIVVAVREGMSYTATGGPRLDATVTLEAGDANLITQGRAKLETPTTSKQSVKELVFTPDVKDIGLTHRFGITVTAGGYTKKIEDFMFVAVTGDKPVTVGSACSVYAQKPPYSAGYHGVYSGTTSGGTFRMASTPSASTPEVLFYTGSDGKPYVVLSVQAKDASLNGVTSIEYPLNEGPRAGIAQTITHPRVSFTGEKNWSYWCRVGPGLDQNFSTFTEMISTLTVIPTSDCKGVALYLEAFNKQYENTGKKEYSCAIRGVFGGTTTY